MEKFKTKYGFLIWPIVLGLFIFLTLNKNSKSSIENANYQFEAWADKGGYYIYLPWAINNSFDASLFKKDLPEQLGNGFSIENEKLYSKYSIGIALLQLPFYLLGHLNAILIYENPTGFEKVYMNWIGVGSVFYLWISFLLIFRLVAKQTTTKTAFFAIVLIFSGTNLFYYAVDETLMTHVYSFFLLTIFSYGIINERKLNVYLLCSIAILITVMRPINLIYVIALAVVFRNELFELKKNIMKIKGIVYLIPGIVVIVLQLFYWSYAYGAFFPKGYEGESFQYFLQPKILKVLFEPNNGWFPYATTVFIGLIGALVVLRKDLFAKRILLLTLLIVSIYTYITASWWTYTFGCGLGARNFVDFSFLWIFLIALVLHSFEERKSIYYSWLGINLVFVIVNVLITYHYDNCWFGEENWDWNFYLELI